MFSLVLRFQAEYRSVKETLKAVWPSIRLKLANSPPLSTVRV